MLSIFNILYDAYQLLYCKGHIHLNKENNIVENVIVTFKLFDLYYIISHLATIILYRTHSDDN